MRVNPNYLHVCNGSEASRLEATGSLCECGFSLAELEAIIDFYIMHPPLKPDNKSKSVQLRWLGEYGWIGSQQLAKLEGELLKISSIGSFIMLKSQSIDDTLKVMRFGERSCIEHPRVVLKWNSTVLLHEDGSTTISTKETRMVCLFRHMRNAIAHGNIFLFNNGNLLLEDKDEDGKFTACMVLRRETLIDWIKVVAKKSDFYGYLFDDDDRSDKS